MSSRIITNLHLTDWLRPCHQRHKNLFFNPLGLLRAQHSSFSVAVQKPGDLILTHNHGSHQGYNTGNNLAIAVNWATMNWVFQNQSRHIHPVTHDIVYDCMCWKGVKIGIPYDVWSSNAADDLKFKYLYTLKKKNKKLSISLSTPGTTWCEYIFLGIKYLHQIVNPIPWLEEKREVEGGEEGMDL